MLAPELIPNTEGPANGLRKTVCICNPLTAKPAPATSAVKACGKRERTADKKQFRRKHEGTLILYEAAAKALKEQGFQKLPDLYALKDEYKLLAEQKDQLQRQYAEAKRQMQEYDIIKQNVDGILRTAPGKEQMQER